MGKIWYISAIFSLLVVVCVGCKSIGNRSDILYQTITTSKQTYVYEKSVLRSQRMETLKEGERVSVLQEPKNRWLQVRTPSGIVGWVESRDLLKREQFEEWEKLAKKTEGGMPQMKGETTEDANLRLRPGRDTVKVFKINGSKTVNVFAVAHTERPGTNPNAGKSAEDPAKKGAVKAAEKPKPAAGKNKKRSQSNGTKYDTWYLVKTPDGVVGWLYSGLVNLEVPEELARYAESKVIVAWRILTISKDQNGNEHPWYLSIERDEDSNLDFDRARVLFWSSNHNRYELAYRIQNIIGVFPVEANRVDPGQPGQPSFKIRHLDENNPNQIIIDEYQMTGSQTKKVATTTEGV